MTEPPPRQLDTSDSIPSKLQMSKRPKSPSLGSQKLRPTSLGWRGNVPGAHALPRSSRTVCLPPSCKRYAVTEPPKPEPTTTASTCSGVLTGGTSRGRTASSSRCRASASAALRSSSHSGNGTSIGAGFGPSAAEVGADRGLGHEIAVVLEHRALAFGEDVEVDADRRDEVAHELLRVRRLRRHRIVGRRTGDAPVRAVELAGDEVRDQPALADVGRLLEQDDREAEQAPDLPHPGVRLERRACVGDEHRRVVLPDRLDAEVVVHAAVGEHDPSRERLRVVAVVGAAARARSRDRHRREHTRQARRRRGGARDRPVAERRVPARLGSDPPDPGIERPLRAELHLARAEDEARPLGQVGQARVAASGSSARRSASASICTSRLNQFHGNSAARTARVRTLCCASSRIGFVTSSS